MGAFDAEWNGEAQITAPTGHELLISRQIFTNHKKNESKIKKNGRENYVLFIADAIHAPDEIWLDENQHGEGSALYFLARYQLKRNILNILAVFKQQGKLWEGWTGYQSFDSVYFKSKRKGMLIYRRGV